jgi:hypothetical protein
VCVGVSADMLRRVRFSAFLPDADPEYDDAQIRRELTETLHTVFGEIVASTRGGFWLDDAITTCTAGKATYRMPARAIAGGLEHIEIANGTGGGWGPMTEVMAKRADELSGPSGTPSQGTPEYFIVEGDQVRLIPCPSTSNFRIKMRYYRRASRVVDEQTRGLISAVNTTARTITVNVIPFDQELSVPAAITSGVTLIDVVHPTGWHELALTGASQTFSGTTITVGGTLDMTKIEVGDYVRAAEQAEWPALPEDFYRTLADAAAVTILTSKGYGPKGAQIAQKMGADLHRFRSLLNPRIKSAPPIIRPTQGFLYGRKRSWPVSYP